MPLTVPDEELTSIKPEYIQKYYPKFASEVKVAKLSSENISPTRINLIQTKKTLKLAESGREVLERKRDILIRELRNSIYDAERAREELLALWQKLTKACEKQI